MLSDWPVHKNGDKGENVRTIQFLLRARGASLEPDGVFGPQTEAAVRAFQQQAGLEADGIVGKMTWPKLKIDVAKGSTGEAVTAVQTQLKVRMFAVAVDGIFGPKTEAAVRTFQAACGMDANGATNTAVWFNLVIPGHPAPEDYAHNMFEAWLVGDHTRADLLGTPTSVPALFAREPSPDWKIDRCEGAAGSTFCQWKLGSERLIMRVNNPTGGAPVAVQEVRFEP
jgi:peptidoglycan hydrolase-like protein with peptidoglycan-binding domain